MASRITQAELRLAVLFGLLVFVVMLSGCASEPAYTRSQRLSEWWGCAPACVRD